MTGGHAPSGFMAVSFSRFGDHFWAYDLSNPTAPQLLAELPPFVSSPPDYLSGLAFAGSIAYAATGEFGGLWMVDVSNPAAPVSLGRLNAAGRAADADTANGFLYVASPDFLHIFDVTDAAHPVL